ncbi:tyrosine-type recombinase/integrase [Rhizobium sp. S-51]|uniref:Tyrosine-type recombinase/integrase n=1 Tax=Rhizobium terricola TaxID=2728849 RepID=A0A7Y0FWA0_9HYPH|nr:tyrosine-type recombinase/integrase [Rhizobium terricola]NML75267.1 tyrosine-type recombinase/integrase [Rhizobium terricola]
MKPKRRNGLPKYCSLVIDRHKKRRIRFRTRGVDTYLPFPPVGAEFEKAYAAALAGVTEWRANIGVLRTRAGSFDALAVSYYRSPAFQGLRDSTKQTYRRIIENFREEHGSRLLRDLRREHVKALIGDMADRPQAANRLLSLLKIMLEHALDNGWIAVNPASGVKGFSKKTKGFHTWTDGEIAAYELRHPEGTKAHLALTLLLYTAQRRSDVVVMGWEKIKGRYIEVKQVKTDAELDLFMLPALTDAIRGLPRDKPTFLTTDFGKPFTPAGFGNWFRDRCNEAGLAHCSAHGLRKAAARRMAEGGMSGDIIKAVTGHTDLKQVSVYTAAANQAALAEKGLKAIAGKKKRTNSDQPLRKVGQSKGE